MARFYITTSIMYSNAAPHIGFALELIQADTIARYRRLLGDDVRFLTGTDEHGVKVFRSAQAAGVEPQVFVDDIAGKVSELARRLNISHTGLIRTSDQEKHWPAAQRIWKALEASGDLYRHEYEGFYCIGHEAFIKQGELVEGLCPLHKTKPEQIREENWFFRLSKYRDQVRKLIETGRMQIIPATRISELLNLLDDAEDVSFSRPVAQLPWGIPVPGDDSQVMYVWADALTNYLSGLGYGTTETDMAFWPADVHLIGKDILRFHAMIWPAMLLAAGLEVPKAIYVHGFITVDGEKMSKSLGNVVDPFEALDRWPAEVLRYFLLREISSTEDGDFSWKQLETRYNADLASGLGNLVQRTLTLRDPGNPGAPDAASVEAVQDDAAYHQSFEAFRLHEALAQVWLKIGRANAYLNEREPWKQVGDARAVVIATTTAMIQHITKLLEPFMPETAAHVAKMLSGEEDKKALFPRR